ncbi:MAG: hypothetical protein WCT08_04540 [Patescibacteria group bacterium]|jgi:hypothetical protein
MQKPLNTVIFVLFSIISLCFLFIGLQVKSLPPHPGGLLILLFGAIFHSIGLFVSIREGNTPAACIIGIFCMFWWYIGIMLVLIALGISTKDQYVSGLKWLEPSVALSVYILSYMYTRIKSLFYILLGLGTTVVYLWAAKAILPGLEDGVPYVVGALGIGSVLVVIGQLKQLKNNLV